MENKSTCHMTNEKRLIDANEFWNRLSHVVYDIFTYPDRPYDCARVGYYTETIQTVLEQTRSVDAVEVVHAMWVYDGRSDEYFCSNCYKPPISFRREMNCGVGELVEVCFSDYCPNCGADMRGETE